MFKTYLINDENTTYIAIFNGEGEYILDRCDDVVFNADGIDPSEYYDMEDYYAAILKRAIELDEFDAASCWYNRAGCCTDIEKAGNIDEVLEREWWGKGYHATYTEV